MNTAAISQPSSITTLDAFWTLFQEMPKKFRIEFIQRATSEMESVKTKRQQRLVRTSFNQAITELKSAQQSEAALPNAWDLLKEL